MKYMQCEKKNFLLYLSSYKYFIVCVLILAFDKILIVAYSIFFKSSWFGRPAWHLLLTHLFDFQATMFNLNLIFTYPMLPVIYFTFFAFCSSIVSLSLGDLGRWNNQNYIFYLACCYIMGLERERKCFFPSAHRVLHSGPNFHNIISLCQNKREEIKYMVTIRVSSYLVFIRSWDFKNRISCEIELRPGS